jgi:mxaJ protein
MRVEMMLKQLKVVLVSLVLVSNHVLAEETIEKVLDDKELPSLNADEGRVGEVRRVDDGTEFKVCADPDNMPYSNLKQEGFEDKIAEVLAKDLGKKLTFAYAYNRQGFLRNTINAGRCDVVIGTTSDYDALRTSKPYYRSGHVFVWRKESGFNITNWDSPDLKKGVIGVIGQSPATIPLRDHDLIAYSKPYRMQRDLNLPTSFMIDDLAKKEIDVAIMWGPIAGYYAKKSPVPMDVVFIPEYNNVDLKGKEYWNISVGVRKKDKARMADIDAALERNKDKIAKILADYGIPTVPVVEGDNVFKKGN